MQPKDYPNQAAHHGIALSNDGTTICDAGTISNYAALISATTLSPLAIVPVGDQPAEAVSSPDGRYCFIADRGPNGNSVSVISYAQRREVARIPVGQHPQEEEVATIPDYVLGIPRSGIVGIHWASAPPVPEPRQEVAYVQCRGKLFPAGGFESPGPAAFSKRQRMFDPVAGRWSSVADLPSPAHHLKGVCF
jgi:YVTN family beta-propeller protein